GPRVTIFDEVRGAGPRLAAWVESLPTDGPDVPVPDLVDLPDALLDLAVPHADVNEIVAVHREVDLAPLRDRCAWAILAAPAAPAAVPVLPASLGAAGRLLSVSVALAVAPHTRRYHADRGIHPDVSRRTLTDVGRQLAKHRRRYGTPGIPNPEWLSTHLR